MEKLSAMMSKFPNTGIVGSAAGIASGRKGILGAAYERTKTERCCSMKWEKAHPRIMDVFLQMLDAARVTIATGETLDLSGFVVDLFRRIDDLCNIWQNPRLNAMSFPAPSTIIAPGNFPLSASPRKTSCFTV